MDSDQGNVSVQCGSCDASFSCWCLDCQEALCEDCVSAHRRVSVTRSHRLLNRPPPGWFTCSQENTGHNLVNPSPVGNVNISASTGHTSTPPTKFCKLHPSEPLKLYCLTCNQLTCRDCQLMTHKNHRYEFVSDALDWLKKQLVDQVQPIRAQRERLRRAMQDMKTRLEDIFQSESHLKLELRQSFRTFLQHLKGRMDQLIKEIRNVHESECEHINRRMSKLTELQKHLESVTEAADKAQNTNDLLTLQTYRTQIESQLKDLSDQDLSPPPTIPQMKVVTDTNSLATILNFGKLEVSWVPFSVSPPSARHPNPPGTSRQSPCSLQAGPPSGSRLPAPPCSTSCSTSSTSQSSAALNLPSASLSLRSASFTSISAAPPAFAPVPPNAPIGALNAAVEQCSQRVPSDSALSLLTVAPPAPRIGTTSASVSSGSCSFSSYAATITAPLSCAAPSQNLQPFRFPALPHFNSSLVLQPLVSGLSTDSRQVQVKLIQPASTFSLVLQPRLSGSSVLKSVPVPDPPQSDSRNQPSAAALHAAPLGPSVPQPSMQEQAPPEPQSPAQADPPLIDSQRSGGPSGHVPPLQADTHRTGPGSSLPEQEDLVHVVKAVADSACDHSVQQVEAAQQEPAENEPTSTMCEEAEPAESECEPAESGSGLVRSGSLSHWQPKVCLFRLPVPTPRPGRPLPAFRWVPGETEDDLFLEDMSDECESHSDVDPEQLSSSSSPVTLQVVSCSACGSADGSIICLSCGRGFHRDCHVPPVGPDFWSEWVCSLCQDLSDPSDPYSSERPQTAPSPCLSPLDQRRCESLLLYLKVEGCGRLSQSHLTTMSKRLSLRHPPAYATASEFLSDVGTLFRETSSQQEDDQFDDLQKRFHMKSLQQFGPELHPSPTPPDRTGSSPKETRKRLSQFLVLMGTSAAKRTKKST